MQTTIAALILAAAFAPNSGAITLNAQPQSRREAVSVTGHAPDPAPVTITLLASFSSEVPDVVVSRTTVLPDANGNFSAVIPQAPDFMRSTILRVVASSGAGVTPATVQLTIGTPNGSLIVPLEQLPQ